MGRHMRSHRPDREMSNGDRLLWICCGNLLWEDQLHGHNRLFRNQGWIHAGAPLNGYPEEISQGVFRVSLDFSRMLRQQQPSMSVTESSPSSASSAQARTGDLGNSLTGPFNYDQGWSSVDTLLHSVLTVPTLILLQRVIRI